MKYYDAFMEGAVNYWEKFPVFKSLSPFKQVYQKDRSTDKNKSSKAMWYMVLCFDVDSDFYSLDANEQKYKIEETLELDVPNYLGDGYDDFCVDFIEFIDTVLSANIRELERKLIDRRKFINRTPYSLDEMVTPEYEDELDGKGNPKKGKPYMKKGTAVQLDKMIASTGAIHKQITDLREDLKREAESENKGGQVDSLIEE